MMMLLMQKKKIDKIIFPNKGCEPETLGKMDDMEQINEVSKV